MPQLKESRTENNTITSQSVLTRDRIIKNRTFRDGGSTKEEESSDSWGLIIAIVIIFIIINFFGFITWGVIKIRSGEIDNISNLISKNQQEDRSTYMLVRFLQIFENIQNQEESINNTQKEVLMNRTTNFEIDQQIEEKEQFLFEPFVRSVIEFVDNLLGIENSATKNFYNSNILIKAYMEERNRNYSDSIKLFERFLEENQNLGKSLKADIFLHIAFNNAIQNNFEEARKNFKEVYKLSDQNSDTFNIALKIQTIMDRVEEEQKLNKKRIEELKKLEDSDKLDLEKLISRYNILLNTNDLINIIELAPKFIEAHKDKINEDTPEDDDWRIGISAVYYYWGRALENMGGKENIEEAIEKYNKVISTGKNQNIENNKVKLAFERLQVNESLYGYNIKSEVKEENEILEKLQEENQDSELTTLIDKTESLANDELDDTDGDSLADTALSLPINQTGFDINTIERLNDQVEENKESVIEEIKKDEAKKEDDKEDLVISIMEEEEAEKKEAEKKEAVTSVDSQLEDATEDLDSVETETLEEIEELEEIAEELPSDEGSLDEELEKIAEEVKEEESEYMEVEETVPEDMSFDEELEKIAEEAIEDINDSENVVEETVPETKKFDLLASNFERNFSSLVDAITSFDIENRIEDNLKLDIAEYELSIVKEREETANLVDLDSISLYVDTLIEDVDMSYGEEYELAKEEIKTIEETEFAESMKNKESLENTIKEAIYTETVKMNAGDIISSIEDNREENMIDDLFLTDISSLDIVDTFEITEVGFMTDSTDENSSESSLEIDFKDEKNLSVGMEEETSNKYLSEMSDKFKEIAEINGNYEQLNVTIVVKGKEEYKGKVISQTERYFVIENESSDRIRVFKNKIISISITDTVDNIISVMGPQVLDEDGSKSFDDLVRGNKYLFLFKDGSSIKGIFVKTKGNLFIITDQAGDTVSLKKDNLISVKNID